VETRGNAQRDGRCRTARVAEERFASGIEHIDKTDAVRVRSSQILAQMVNERDWERQKKPTTQNPSSGNAR